MNYNTLLPVIFNLEKSKGRTYKDGASWYTE